MSDRPLSRSGRLAALEQIQTGFDAVPYAGRLSLAQDEVLGRVNRRAMSRQGHRAACDRSHPMQRFGIYAHGMSHTHAAVLVHCVFSTKQRIDTIPDPQSLWCYLATVAKDKRIMLLAAGGTKNHVHLLLSVPPVVPLAKAIQELKASSSRWIHEHGYRFAWQEGYGAFSISQSQRQTVIDYIDTQAEHHQRWTFEQEFMTLLTKSGATYDPRFVFG